MGLTIARGIARAHGGDVTASSPGPGKGATFTLWIPMAFL
ncbi:sensor histidine kinase [Streptomyces sp.]